MSHVLVCNRGRGIWSGNILRNSNNDTQITTGTNGEWVRSGDSTLSTRTNIQITDCPDPTITRGWHIEHLAGTSAGVGQWVPLRAGTVYTIGAYFRGSGTAGFQINADTSAGTYLRAEYSLPDSGQWYRVSHTFVLGPAAIDTNGKIVVRFFSRTGAKFDVCGMTLVRGAHDTGWSPALEDILSRLDALEAKVGITAAPPMEQPEIMDT